LPIYFYINELYLDVL